MATGTKPNDTANAMVSQMAGGGVIVSAGQAITLPSDQDLRRSADGGLAMMGNGDIAQVNVPRNVGFTGAGHIDAGIIKQPCSLFPGLNVRSGGTSPAARRTFRPFEARSRLALTDKAA